jgi:acetylglutamate kinase
MPVQDVRAESNEETDALGTIVVKIGGSTLGDHDTTLTDLVTLQRRGVNSVVVHGGGKVISDWMVKQGVRPRFVRGLRVTDRPSLDIVVAVLTGLVNKSLVASILALGGRAIGISGADGGMLTAEVQDPDLGLVGRIVNVNREPIDAVLDSECIPVIAPVSLDVSTPPGEGAGLLNVNADTVAGEIAAALGASRLLFLTDVPGVLDSSRRLIPRLTARQARGLMRSRIVAGGMVPKLEACLTAVESEGVAQIVDGRSSHALLECVSGEAVGTRIG